MMGASLITLKYRRRLKCKIYKKVSSIIKVVATEELGENPGKREVAPQGCREGKEILKVAVKILALTKSVLY